MRNFIIAFLFVCFCCGALCDEVYEDMDTLKSSAIRGNPRSQGILAGVYRRGARGVPKDYVEAFKWAEPSAKNNDPFGLYNLAVLYEGGLGVKADKKEALSLYKKAFAAMRPLADKGNEAAQYDFGYMLLKGKGAEKDEKKALIWIEKAASQGYTEAQYCLGHCLYTGIGGQQDSEEALTWFLKAAASNNRNAQYMAALCYLKKHPSVEKYNPRALVWLLKAARQGEPNAQYLLSSMYFSGRGVDKNTGEGFRWLQRASAQGQKEAVAKMKFILKEAKKKQDKKGESK